MAAVGREVEQGPIFEAMFRAALIIDNEIILFSGGVVVELIHFPIHAQQFFPARKGIGVIRFKLLNKRTIRKGGKTEFRTGGKLTFFGHGDFGVPVDERPDTDGHHECEHSAQQGGIEFSH